MKDPIRCLRREVAGVRVAARGSGHRYPEALRNKIVLHARPRRARGESLAAISRDLEVTAPTLQRWLSSSGSSGFRRVEVASAEPMPASSPAPAVILPSGVRIEGLDLAGLVILLRELA